ncbi:hypothetical protein [Clavibacter nebraskensis]|uniref:hypothetical protein n=1 Tax=Clavibacter nebraskensis TaxID=31963 RepID=UPI003F4C422A
MSGQMTEGTRQALTDIRSAVDGANLDAGANASALCALGTIRLILEDAELRRLEQLHEGQVSTWA